MNNIPLEKYGWCFALSVFAYLDSLPAPCDLCGLYPILMRTYLSFETAHMRTLTPFCTRH